jgi:hypothetical protein
MTGVRGEVASPRSLPAAPGLLVAARRPAPGLDGFRTTHDEAVTAVRLAPAGELLGRSVKEQQGMLWTALHLAHLVDPAEMTSSA